jgi:thioredoxin 1
MKEDLNMSAIKINKNNFNDEVLRSDKPVLLDFWASWCGPCRMVGPILDEIAEEREDIKVCKINVDEEPELASEYRIMSIPSLMVMKDGQIVSQSVGAKPKAQILAML